MAEARPAGWYPDPERAGQLRYWDGSAWTENRVERKPNLFLARLRRSWPVFIIPVLGIAAYLILGAPKKDEQAQRAVDAFSRSLLKETGPAGPPGHCLRAAEVSLQADPKADVFAPDWQAAIQRACREVGPDGSVATVAGVARAAQRESGP